MPNPTSKIGNRKFFAGLLLILLTACSAGTQPSTGIHVLAAETWLADIAQNVAGNRLHVDSLLPPGVDPHEFQPAPQDAIKIAQSQVLIVNGFGYETWLANTLQPDSSQQTVLVASDGFPSARGGEPDDPHLWMNPLNVVKYAENIRNGLSKADPDGRSLYAANAQAYIAKLKDLDASIKSQVAQIPPERRLLITNHDALGYFAQAYGFDVVGAIIPSVTNESSPSAQQLAGLIDTAKKTHAPAVFLDVSENRNLAEQISSATGARVITDLYVETLSAPDGPAPTYIAMLQHDAATIVEALK